MAKKSLLLTSLLLAFALSLFGQGSGSLVGTVTDPSGAAVPSAKVTATNVGTGASRLALTAPDGYYVIPSLEPSVYKLNVDAVGFRAFTQTNITLLANQTLTVNVSLALGPTTESITVQATAVQVDTSTGTLRQVVDETRMVELPLNGRNAAQLTLLVAGAFNAPSDGIDQGSTKTFPAGVTISVNGAQQGEVSYQLDGGNNTDEYTNINQPFPFPDALQEFSVQTSNYSAEYGQNAGAVVNVVTKSGTNDLHGDAFGFVRNAVFNARNFFAAQRDQLKRGQFGATAGGPVVLPGYNGRNRTFFFLGYQGTRIRNLQGGLSAFVPTQANVSGDFSALLNAGNPDNPVGKIVQIKDPVTGQPFPGNLIPATRFDPASLGALPFLPKANGNGLVYFTKPIAQNFDEGIGRIDHSLSNNDRITGRYYLASFDQPAVFQPVNLLTYADGSTIVSQNALLRENHIFRPNLLNDFRFSYARVGASRGPAPQAPNVGDFGVRGLWLPPQKAIESVAVSGFFSAGDNPSAAFVRNDFAWADDLRWVHGRHNLSFGVTFERSRVDVGNQVRENGNFSFSGDATGYAMADFFLGRMRTFVQGNGQYMDVRNSFVGVYVQDSLHATSRLTVNFGLRYDPLFPWHEVHGKVEQFRPDAYFNNQTSARFINAPPGLLFPGDPGVPPNGTTSDLNNFAPRAGFAYDLLGTGKTSLRGGAGVFYDARQRGLSVQRWVTVTPWSPLITITSPTGPFSNPYQGVLNPFPTSFPPPRDIAFPAPVLALTFDPTQKFVTPVLYDWNLAIEHQLAPQWLLRAAYVASHGSHLFDNIDLNPAVYTPGSTASSDQRRIFRGFSDIYQDSQDVNSSFQSLQLSLERRLTHGLTILANYTFSKSIDDFPFGTTLEGTGQSGGGTLPWYFPNSHSLDHGPSDFDHTHRFVASYVWQLGQLHSWGRLAGAVLGNWSLSGLLTAQSGDALTILAGKDQSQTALGKDRGLLVGQPYGTGACKNSAPCVDYLSPSSFALPTTGTFGNLAKGAVRGPNLFSWDMGLFRSIPFTERLRIEIRGEFFNVFNRVNRADPSTSVSAGGFGSIRSAADPRIGQFALKIFY
jgi:hypothetical protein